MTMRAILLCSAAVSGSLAFTSPVTFARGGRAIARRRDSTSARGSWELYATRIPPPKLRLPIFPDPEDEENAETLKQMAPVEVVAASEKAAAVSGWDYWKYRAILVFVAALWGTNFGTVKFIDNAEIIPSVGAAVRFGIAALAMSPFLRNIKKDVLLAGLECGLWITLGYFTQAVGLCTTDANKSAFICSLTVVVVPLINALSGKPIKPANVIAAALALAGCGFLELGDGGSLGMGDVWSLGQPLGFGIAFTRIEHYMEKFPGKSLALTAGQLLTVAASSLAWCLYASHGTLPDFSFLSDVPVAAALGYTGLVTTALAVLLETVALQHVAASEMSVIFSTEPLWATAFSAALLGETLGPQAVVGAALILGACLTAQGPQVLEMLRGGSSAQEEQAAEVVSGLPAFAVVPQDEDSLFGGSASGREDDTASTGGMAPSGKRADAWGALWRHGGGAQQVRHRVAAHASRDRHSEGDE